MNEIKVKNRKKSIKIFASYKGNMYLCTVFKRYLKICRKTGFLQDSAERAR